MNQDNNALARTKAASLRKKMVKFEFFFRKDVHEVDYEKNQDPDRADTESRA